MRLKLTLRRPAADDIDLLVTVDTTVSVGEIASALHRRDPSAPPQLRLPTLRADLDGRPVALDPAATVAESQLRSGQTIAVEEGASEFVSALDRPTVATLHVVDGPDAGRSFPLRSGANHVGRERTNDIVLHDPLVSKQHARINVGETIEMIDLGSSNGVLVGDDLVSRITLAPNDVVLLGDTKLRIERLEGGASDRADGAVFFNRSPRLDPVYEGRTIEAPEPPRPRERTRFPVVVLIAPVLLGVALFAITRQAYTVLFIALSPIMMLGNCLEGRMAGGRSHREAVNAFHAGLAALETEVARETGAEALARRAEHPAVAEVIEAARLRDPLLWTRRPDQHGFLELRVGLADLASLVDVELPRRGDAEPALWDRLVAVKQRYERVASVPVVASFEANGAVGVSGPRETSTATARSLVASLVGLHSPADVVVAAVASPSAAADWEWLKWLPHVGSDHSPLTVDHLASTPSAVARLVAAVDELIGQRTTGVTNGETVRSPRVIVVVDDSAPIERSRLVDIAERGPAAGVHVLWVASTVERLPAACRTFIDHDPSRASIATVGDVTGAAATPEVRVDQLNGDEVLAFARSLSPVVDAGAPVDDDSDLPRQVALLNLIGVDTAQDPASVVDRWRTTNSLPSPGEARARRGENTLRAVVGSTVGQNFVLDLRAHGPHALVGGTTGSGKSEFLQTWVLSMAAEHSASRITFLFVDYKGGAAFGDCINLPHCVGLVTDLTPHLVDRALTSLDAELRHREAVLREKKAKDLLELEGRGDPDAPPSLAIVVDEFAALATEVPEFVDGVVNVAQRGRSLGLHLVLATQRPAGVIKDNLRANTNLRIALRVADEDDSLDVVGTPQAAAFDASIPGRAIAKTGPGRLTPFQSAYVGGWTSDEPPPAVVVVHELGFGVGNEWAAPDAERMAPEPSGATDLRRLVASIRGAHEAAAVPNPRRPWLPALASVYDLAKLPQSRRDDELVFGVVDDPARQSQRPLAFNPDRDGNMAVFGTGGAGKTTFLRSIAVAAGLATRTGPCHVYGIDFAGRGLELLSSLPHVGSIVAGDDHERLTRLLRWLRSTIDTRAAKFAQARAGGLEDFRAATGAQDEPRIVVLIDGMASFRGAYEVGERVRWLDVLNGIAGDGRQFGVHFVLSADRATAIPTAMSSAVQRRLVLRLATEQDYAMADVADAAALAGAPPGRGLLDGMEVQVAVLGGSASAPRQAAALERFAEMLQRAGDRAEPARIGRLTERVTLADLPPSVDGMPVLGIADETLDPIGFSTDDPLFVVGPTGSGVTSVLASLTLSVRRTRPVHGILVGARRSPLWQLPDFETKVSEAHEIEDLASTLATACDDGRLGPGSALIVIEDVQQLIDSGAETAGIDIARRCTEHGLTLIAAADSTVAGGFSQLLQWLRARRHGLALQPEQHEGEQLFKAPYPRVSRSEFPPGRGFYVRKGVVARVQCALPEVEL